MMRQTRFLRLLGKGLTKYSRTGKAKWRKQYRGSNLSCKDWRLQVEDDGAESELVQQLKEGLDYHKTTRHPGYSFTGDNVEMRILPHQMTLTNKNKDHHMYQMVAFKNRISSNHLPNVSPKNDTSQVLFSSFLPNAEDQSTLIEELIILIGHVWGKYISSLAWFTECLPGQIVHAQMENTKKKTEKVGVTYLAC